MQTFSSEQYCDTENTIAYEGLYSHDRVGSIITIKDALITDDTVARARARAELLKGGYAERWVSIKTIHIAGLKQNDIIKFGETNWIVKEIALDYQPPTLIMNIKGLRYE